MSGVASARGLFRAAGKTARPVAQRAAAGGYEKVDKVEREPLDFYPTPPEPTRALLHAEADRLGAFHTIWEPAAGDGAMVREIVAAGHRCIGSDLVDRGCGAEIRDFYAFEAAPAPAIITNPPYFEINARDGRGRWVEHALGALGVDYMAVLLNWNWFCAAGLDSVLRRWPPARVYACCWKVDFTGAGQPPMNSAWVVWDQAARSGGTELLRLHRNDDARQSNLFPGGRQ